MKTDRLDHSIVRAEIAAEKPGSDPIFLNRLRRIAPAAVALAAAIVFGSLAASPAGAQRFPEFSDPGLQQGRRIWLGTCEACHANAIAEAPLVTNKAAWRRG